jgi:hypothetical protein
LSVLAQIIKKEVNRWLGKPGAPLSLGLVKADVDLAVFDRHFRYQQLFDRFVQVGNHGLLRGSCIKCLR